MSNKSTEEFFHSKPVKNNNLFVFNDKKKKLFLFRNVNFGVGGWLLGYTRAP